jgi:hypothetical protein
MKAPGHVAKKCHDLPYMVYMLDNEPILKNGIIYHSLTIKIHHFVFVFHFFSDRVECTMYITCLVTTFHFLGQLSEKMFT